MAAATMYVTPAGAGAKNGSSWANAFGLAEWETDAETLAESGDLYYLLAGTYTLTAHFDARPRDATTLAPIRVIGVSDEALTPATGDDRPLIAQGNKYFRFGSYWHIENIRITGSAPAGLLLEAGGLIRNSKCHNTSSAAFSIKMRSNLRSGFS